MKADAKPSRRRSRRGNAWRHPSDAQLRVPRKTAAAIAVMEMGIKDYRLIGEAVGLEAADVKEIDLAGDGPIRRLGVQGIPAGEYFNLRTTICCPKCGAKVTIAPCVACSSQKASS